METPFDDVPENPNLRPGASYDKRFNNWLRATYDTDIDSISDDERHQLEGEYRVGIMMGEDGHLDLIG
jgi:hypothetical protein